MTKLCFVDTETISLKRPSEAYNNQIWEVGLIVQEQHTDTVWKETFSKTWQLPVNLGEAEPIALQVGGFHERRFEDSKLTPLSHFAGDFARLTGNKSHLVGAIVSFDEERLYNLLRQNGACPEWHYHIVDVEALAIGYLRGLESGIAEFEKNWNPPWKSDLVWEALGIDRNQPEFAAHTAMGDARLVQYVYNLVMGIKLES